MDSLDKNVRNRNEISEMLKRLLLRVSRLEINSGNGGNNNNPNGWDLVADTIALTNYLTPPNLGAYPIITSVIPFSTLPNGAIVTKKDLDDADYIPLAGTKVSKPVTGDIQIVESNSNIGLVRNNTIQDWVGEIKFSNKNSSLMSRNVANAIFSKLTIEKEGVTINNSSTSKGLYSETVDYTINYPIDGTEDKIFPQIKYIKDNFCEEAPENGNSYVRNNGAWAVALSGGGIVVKTRAEFLALIASSTLIPGTTYRINGLDGNFCDGFFVAITTNTFNPNGVGLFQNPNYGLYQLWRNQFYSGVTLNVGVPIKDEVYTLNGNSFIWKTTGLYVTNQDVLPDGVYVSGLNSVTVASADVQGYNVNDIVIFGNKHWRNLNGNLGTKVDELTLGAEWTQVTTNTLPVIDEIVYDIANDWISTRKDSLGNEITFFKSGTFNYVKTFSWGTNTCYNNEITNWNGVSCNLPNYLQNNNVNSVFISNNITNYFSFSNNSGNNFSISDNTGNSYTISDNSGNGYTLQYNTGNGFSLYSNSGNDFNVQSNTGNSFTFSNNTGNNHNLYNNSGNSFTFSNNTGNSFNLYSNTGNNHNLYNNSGNDFNVYDNLGDYFSININSGVGFNVYGNTGNNYNFYNNIVNYFSLTSNTVNTFTMLKNIINDFGIQNNTINSFDIQNNTVNHFYIYSNTGNDFSLFGNTINIFGLSDKVFISKAIQYCDIKNVEIDAGVNISSATHLFAGYGKSIFKNSANAIVVSYVDASNVQVITGITT